ncbi:MAG: MFS transporter [Candidatus Hodarchaeales archaeon]|jgi:MFS family permease
MKSVRPATLNIITLVFTYFLWGFANFIFSIQIQPFIIDLFGDNEQIAQLLGAILSIGGFFAVIPLLFSFYSDTHGRKKFILLGQSLSFIGLIGLSFGNTQILVLIFCIILVNVGLGVQDSPLIGLVYESTTEKHRGLVYAIIYNSGSIAGIISSILLEKNTTNDSYLTFFRIGTISIFIILIMNFLLLSDIKPNVSRVNFSIRNILSTPISQLTVIAFVVDSFAWGLPLSIANGIFILLFEVNVSFIATLILFQSISIVILQYPAGFLVDRMGKIFGLIVGEITGIIFLGCVQLALMNPIDAKFLLLVGEVVLGISIAFWRPAITISFIDVDPTIPSTNFGIMSFFQRMGWVPTAAIGGFLFSMIGFTPLLVITFVGTLIAMILFYKINRLEILNKSHISKIDLK